MILFIERSPIGISDYYCMTQKVHGGNIYQFAKNHNIAPQDVIDFSANINPLGANKKGVDMMKSQIDMITHYPDPNHKELLDVAAQYYKIDPSMIVAGNGAAEILSAICRLPNYTGVMVPAPGFSEYESSASMAHMEVAPIYYKCNEDEKIFEVPYTALKSFAAKLHGQDGRVILFLGNPNNPDGTLLDIDQVDELARIYDYIDSLLVIDESFIDFTDGSHSVRQLVRKHDNLIVVHSLTKFFAVPGLRIGLAFANTSLTRQIQSLIPTWSVNSLAQVYAIEALQDISYSQATKEYIRQEKERMYDAYNALPGVVAYKPSVNFMLIHWQHKKVTVEDLKTFLEDHQILIRSCDNFYGLGNDWFRIAIKSVELNNRLLMTIKEFMNEYNLFG